MVVRTAHLTLTLRGDSVTEGIAIADGQIQFSPQWGMIRGNPGMLASASLQHGELDTVHVAVTASGVALVPCEDAHPQKELVLVLQYYTGCGAKRWPSFHVEFGPEVKILSRAGTSGGSGGEDWVLVSAPLGWTENIAGQFVDGRDEGDQTIAYRPSFDRKREATEQELAEARDELADFDQVWQMAIAKEDDYLILSFRQSTHPKTGDRQWEYTTPTTKYVVNQHGEDQPESEEERWACQKIRVLVNKPRFQLVVVDLIYRESDRNEISAEIKELESRLG